MYSTHHMYERSIYSFILGRQCCLCRPGKVSTTQPHVQGEHSSCKFKFEGIIQIACLTASQRWCRAPARLRSVQKPTHRRLCMRRRSRRCQVCSCIGYGAHSCGNRWVLPLTAHMGACTMLPGNGQSVFWPYLPEPELQVTCRTYLICPCECQPLSGNGLLMKIWASSRLLLHVMLANSIASRVRNLGLAWMPAWA